MSEPADLEQQGHADLEQQAQGSAELLDALPVPVGGASPAPAPGRHDSQLTRATPALPAVQAAAVAAGSFVAGAAVAGLVHRRRRRAQLLARGRRGRRLAGAGARTGRGPARAAELVQIVGSRSLLVDVHLLGGSGGR
jgi:hypothetical protein